MRTFGTAREGAVVYRNPRQSIPFARRGEPGGPPVLRQDRGRLSGSEDLFYWGLAVNYQAFGYLEQAVRAYGRALEAPLYEPVMYQRIVTGMTSCILQRSPSAATEFLTRAADQSPTPEIRAALMELRERIGSGELSSPPSAP